MLHGLVQASRGNIYFSLKRFTDPTSSNNKHPVSLYCVLPYVSPFCSIDGCWHGSKRWWWNCSSTSPPNLVPHTKCHRTPPEHWHPATQLLQRPHEDCPVPSHGSSQLYRRNCPVPHLPSVWHWEGGMQQGVGNSTGLCSSNGGETDDSRRREDGRKSKNRVKMNRHSFHDDVEWFWQMDVLLHWVYITWLYAAGSTG